MNCDICHRPHHQHRLPFLCPVDARNRLYEGRVSHAQALIENEQLGQQINHVLSNSNARARDPSCSTKVLAENWRSQEQQARDKTTEIIAQADKLRLEVDAARKNIERRKEANARRRSDLGSASNGIAARRVRQQEETERAIQMTKYKWNRSFESLVGTRSFLCMEAARLYGLRRLRKGTSVRFEIGGVEVVEVPALNNASPEVVSTSLAHMSHILMLASHYLAIRLPAEITLPHRDYPRPTIFSLGSSYQHGEVPFPGTASFLPPESRERDSQHLPRPRPLFLDKPLSTLAKEDPVTYSLFIEGIALLAYDIAWACSSQGVPIGDKNSYEDVCNMGRNLYNLLIGNQLHSQPVGRTFPTANPSANADSNEVVEPGEIGRAATLMGRYSHGTAHTFLGSADGNEFARTFKLPNPIKLADRLKKKLTSDASIPEWEMLEDEAWAVDDNGLEEGVVVKNRRQGESDKGSFGAESMMTVRNALDVGVVAADGDPAATGGEERGAEKPKGSGTSGWTKLKNR